MSSDNTITGTDDDQWIDSGRKSFKEKMMSSDNTKTETDDDEWVQRIENEISKSYIKYYEYDEFKNVEHTGFGAFDDVYKANWKNFNDFVLLKSFRNNKVIMKEVVNELRLREKILHRNIIYLIGVTKEHGNYAFVLEYADGGTLRNYLKKNFYKLDWNIKLQFATQIAAAVSYLHQEDIVHRDLHSKNILVCKNTIKLADFGLSCRIAEVSNTVRDIFGILPYIDPQHFKKRVDKNHRYKPNKKSDVYSVGVLLWEISSGKKPFKSYDNPYSKAELILKLLKGKREDPVFDTPSDYIDIYTRCWKNDPDDRPDMQQVFSKLKLINMEDEIVDHCEKCGEQYTDVNHKWCKPCQINNLKNNFTNWTSKDEKTDNLIQEMQLKINNYDDIIIEWIPYNQFDDVKEMNDGELSITYSAIWKNGPLYYDENKKGLKRKQDKKVTVSRLHYPQDVTNKAKAYSINKHDNIFKIYGISQDPGTKSYMMILEYAEGGNLIDWMDKNYKELNWSDKLSITIDIIISLKEIHEKQMIHQSLNPGSILLNNPVAYKSNRLYISDMELCKKVGDNNDDSIYGILPYMGPEVLRNKPTQASDIYSFGMIMYFIATGKQPFSSLAYDTYLLVLDICRGTRPEIKEPEAPKCYIDLMKKCWDSNPDNRPNVIEVKGLIELFCKSYCDKRGDEEIKEQFDEAERYRQKNVILQNPYGVDTDDKPYSPELKPYLSPAQ